MLDQFRRQGVGLEEYSLSGTRRPRVQRQAQRRGRKGHPDLFLAELARDYLAACGRGSRRPTADVAERRQLDRDRVRDLLSKARGRQLLTTVKHGRGGGQLTAKARAILAEVVPEIVPASTRNRPQTSQRQPAKKKETPR